MGQKYSTDEKMVWFTSDQHFNHKNIIGYSGRPFQHVNEMNETIITNFNSVVRDKDEVYHVGDFIFEKDPFKVLQFWNRLNGRHHFMMGNHDKWMSQFLAKNCDKMVDVKFEEPLIEITVDSQQIVLCHYALACWRISYRGSWMLHGHSHGKYRPKTGKILDIGVDSHGFYPVSYEQVREYMGSRQTFSKDLEEGL